MPHNSQTKNLAIARIAQKELTLFFASPLAYLFLSAFVGLCLFAVFWGESFFARNIADVRPLFEWMPLMLIFLCAALTMRMWSEEKRSGTLEFIITVPTATWQFVVGKFLACLALLTTALLITLVLPLSLSLFVTLDWGPIFSAYLATLLLGSAYLAIGLFVSARSDNQIVSLMLTTLVCGLFYFIGSDLLVNLFNAVMGDTLKLLGTGSRFESITRGVIDLRDLYYYLSLTAVFLCLNIFALEKSRWAEKKRSNHHRQWRWLTALAVINLLVVNIWLQPVTQLRADMTEGDIYSISPATHGYLNQLQEPLLIRGYFSDKTHPLLAPLVPQLRDLLKEYEVAGEGRVRTEFIDPLKHPELEQEASQKFGIQPVPLQVADRHQASVVNAYFDIVVQYGDEFQTLGFKDLIEIKHRVGADLDVKLRNPEYDITRALKKVLYSYQTSGKLFDTVKQPLTLTAYISDDSRLPESLQTLKGELQAVVRDLQQQAGDRLRFKIEEPEANGGLIAREITEQYGFSPMAANLFSGDRFYFYMLLNDGRQAVQIPLPEAFTREQLAALMDAGIKRFASGFMKTIGLFGAQQAYGNKSLEELRLAWSENYRVEDVTLDDGRVPGDVDILALISPENISEKQLFAIDQFLMQGGTVMMATSPYTVTLTNTELSAREQASGLEVWLEHHGLNLEKALVMDSRNAPFPVPVQRQVGPIVVREMSMLDYPYFIDIREEGLNQQNMMTSSLQQITMPWASPITLDAEKHKELAVTNLLQSSQQSWRSTSTQLLPSTDGSFNTADKRQSDLLGVTLQGRFTSWFSGKDSPLLSDNAESENSEAAADASTTVVSSVIEKSADSARLILFASNEMVNDQTLHVAGMANGTPYRNSVELLTNAVEWSLEDTGLLSIRSRSHFSRTLPPLEQSTQLILEVANYLAALFMVIGVYAVRRYFNHKRHQRYAELLGQGA